MMRYQEIQPPEHVREIVQTFWVLEHRGEGVPSQRVVPDGHSELILNWGRPFEALDDGRWIGQPRAFLAGQIDGPLLLRPTGPAKMLGIRFHPHGAARIFSTPMDELSGRFTPVEDLSAVFSRDCAAALESANAFDAIAGSLWNRSRPGDVLIGESVRRIITSHGRMDLSKLVRELGLSIRQFERRFLESVGLTPSKFCGIERFSRVFQVLGRPTCHWVDTAIACGYYDQAHLIRDCKKLAGTTPAVLMAEDADLARHFYRRFGVSHSSNTARAIAG